ncbi:Tat proofreading chaperone DmsD [Slackia heliotrinireducens]|uniref:Uncharacterized component of anaerobic dehydrogenase n=1 Tax=Slackia heliotrinireducens (strain ATCC 29202 / DSM 20476 / NCTC 11029 / RHS 1) TaxID=471855 RepID=C7N2X3_SLAHD|nr:Tat proofreading chaperone DmsD [Slackia heliotrinireducens]ACV21494.1 uncharacterized component of anaerobic dehydrogenase [Slackia heliotrinireducens DSM 20476]VEG98933.1 Twin-arginine leader-binding protein DmsD [Slackia heliotrinireducens]
MAQEQTYQGIAAAARMLGLLFSCDPKLDDESPELFATIANMDADETAAEWPGVDAGKASALLLDLQKNAPADHSELASAYRHLFVGPTKLAAPPYGSVYTDRDQVVFGESTIALRTWMRRAGIGADGLDGAPEDHIGTMLLLLSWLVEHKPELVEEYLTDHLLTWAPHYLDELEEAAEGGFYGTLARLANETLTGIEDELDLQVELPRFYR